GRRPCGVSTRSAPGASRPDVSARATRRGAVKRRAPEESADGNSAAVDAGEKGSAIASAAGPALRPTARSPTSIGARPAASDPPRPDGEIEAARDDAAGDVVTEAASPGAPPGADKPGPPGTAAPAPNAAGDAGGVAGAGGGAGGA